MAPLFPLFQGVDHLRVTWKVAEGIHQHIDVKEEKKENAFSLGKSLWINGEEYDDLDEIVARCINPMSSRARDILNYKYYRDTKGGNRDVAEEILREEKRKAPNKIPYIVSVVAATVN
jgi:transcription elongation factor SPT6